MNATSRAILQTLLSSDESIIPPERQAIKNLMDGLPERTIEAQTVDRSVLVTQKQAAKLLSVNRVTIYRMTRDHILHPVEILPGTWRYPLHEITGLAQRGMAHSNESSRGRALGAMQSAA